MLLQGIQIHCTHTLSGPSYSPNFLTPFVDPLVLCLQYSPLLSYYLILHGFYCLFSSLLILLHHHIWDLFLPFYCSLSCSPLSHIHTHNWRNIKMHFGYIYDWFILSDIMVSDSIHFHNFIIFFAICMFHHIFNLFITGPSS